MMFSESFSIGKQTIGKHSPVYFIADIAANHDGSLTRAKDLIYLAKEAGAHCAKFQHFLADKIVSDYGFKNLVGRQSHQSSWKKSVPAIYDQYHCKREWTEELVKTCKDVDIEFMTTPYDFEAIDSLDSYVNAYKIGSGDITWHEIIAHVASKKKPVLLASGASSLEDVTSAVNMLQKITQDIVLMQCNTNYTADIENFKYINLRVLRTFRELYPQIILGLSDHTLGHSTVLGSVALGAKVIEKHFTDDNDKDGPDHKFAMNPETWREMVERVCELELALGDGVKRVEKNEEETVVVQRRSLRLKRAKQQGELLQKEDVEVLRPAPLNSYAPNSIEELIGKKFARSKDAGDCLLFDDFIA